MKRFNKLFYCYVIDTLADDTVLHRVDGSRVVILCTSDFATLLANGFQIFIAEDFGKYSIDTALCVSYYNSTLRRAHRSCKYICCNRRLPIRM